MLGFLVTLAGLSRFLWATAIVWIVGGLGTWLIAPGNEVTVGASGVVFGYATYLFTRGLFNRNLLELLVGGIVGVVWGGALLTSLVPHYGISWQDHASGAVGGVVAAGLLARDRTRATRSTGAVQLSPRP